MAMELREAFPPGTNIQRPERRLLRAAVLGSPDVIHDGVLARGLRVGLAG